MVLTNIKPLQAYTLYSLRVLFSLKVVHLKLSFLQTDYTLMGALEFS